MHFNSEGKTSTSDLLQRNDRKQGSIRPRTKKDETNVTPALL